jgi:ssDNA-binding Zn-finger/Zn-ribbon topoisomerase 1
MTDERPSPTTGEESVNDWYACVQRQKCGYIEVRPNGRNESCPRCNSGLEKYHGELWECAECGTEYLSQGDAKDCCF